MNTMRKNDATLIQRLLGVSVLLFLCLSPVQAATPVSSASGAAGNAGQTQSVQALEDTLYAIHYDQESLDARIGRLEETVFGQTQTNLSLDGRISKLKNALSPTALGPLSPNPKTPPTSTAAKPAPKQAQQPAMPNTWQQANGAPAFAPPNQNATAAPRNTVAAQPAPLRDETEYPAVSMMEQKLFAKTFTQEDVTQRLVRLEKEVFKTVQTGALSDRVDNLRLVVLGDTGTSDTSTIASYQPVYQSPYSANQSYSSNNTNTYGNAPYDPNQGDPYYNPSSASGGQGGYGSYGAPSNATGHVSPDMLAAMSEVEKEVLGHSYASDPLSDRLDRVEHRIFSTTSPELAPEDRMQRIIAVSSAGGAPQSARSKAKSTFQTLLPIILTILPMVLL